MEKLFLEAQQISKKENTNEQDLLESHINQAMKLITKSYEKIIRYNASKHNNRAILILLNSKYLYNNIINISMLLEPSDRLINKHKEYKIKFLMEKLVDFFHPFTINIIRGNNILKIIENSIKHKININNIDNNIICLSISWNERKGISGI